MAVSTRPVASYSAGAGVVNYTAGESQVPYFSASPRHSLPYIVVGPTAGEIYLYPHLSHTVLFAKCKFSHFPEK